MVLNKQARAWCFVLCKDKVRVLGAGLYKQRFGLVFGVVRVLNKQARVWLGVWC